MRVTWLTQSGLLFENSRARIMVDPYLADTMGKRDEKRRERSPLTDPSMKLTPTSSLSPTLT
ncbi:MAG: hypothetical protein IJW61_01220 [Clostridia bacterium]|nr:hypothetical protein [Clostridia bacterium]